MGTGFIVRANGVVVTNCHVVQGASRITVSTSEDEPTRYDARVIGGDCEHDLAVLKIDGEGLTPLPLGASADLRLGQQVVAVGYALALEGGPSVTTGIVSSLDRTIRVPDPQCTVCSNGVRTYSEVIQTDAAINHGNSGGPLVDMEGRVVGINSAGSENAENIGFAISIDSAKTGDRRRRSPTRSRPRRTSGCRRETSRRTSHSSSASPSSREPSCWPRSRAAPPPTPGSAKAT